MRQTQSESLPIAELFRSAQPGPDFRKPHAAQQPQCPRQRHPKESVDDWNMRESDVGDVDPSRAAGAIAQGAYQRGFAGAARADEQRDRTALRKQSRQVRGIEHVGFVGGRMPTDREPSRNLPRAARANGRHRRMKSVGGHAQTDAVDQRCHPRTLWRMRRTSCLEIPCRSAS